MRELNIGTCLRITPGLYLRGRFRETDDFVPMRVKNRFNINIC